jgi:hypothetical protein
LHRRAGRIQPRHRASKAMLEAQFAREQQPRCGQQMMDVMAAF